MPLVDVVVSETHHAVDPISGVSLSVFDATTRELLASGVTDAEGVASFLLPGTTEPGMSYEVMAFKRGAIFTNPTRIQVLTSGIHVYDLHGTLLTLPVATDPLLCRCTGRFLDALGQAQEGLWIGFGVDGELPLVLSGDSRSQDVVSVNTDARGEVSVDLLRGQTYYVVHPGITEEPTRITVPDRPSANLFDLLYPYQVSLEWSSGNALTLAVGESREIPYTILFSDGLEHREIAPTLKIAYPDDQNVDFSGERLLRVTATAPGSFSIVPSFIYPEPHRSPAPKALLPTLTVTVTP